MQNTLRPEPQDTHLYITAWVGGETSAIHQPKHTLSIYHVDVAASKIILYHVCRFSTLESNATMNPDSHLRQEIKLNHFEPNKAAAKVKAKQMGKWVKVPQSVFGEPVKDEQREADADGLCRDAGLLAEAADDGWCLGLEGCTSLERRTKSVPSPFPAL